MSFLNIFRIGSLISKEIAEGAVFETLRQPLQSLKNYHFVQFRKNDQLHGNVYGLSISTSRKKAQIIAYFEYLDRKAFLDNFKRLNIKSTNGLASHKFRRLAIESATSELYERDSFFIHWYSQIPMKEESAPWSLSDQIAELKKDHSFETHFFETYLGYAATQVVFLVNSNTGGFCIGSSCKPNKNDSKEKAFLEAVINLFFGNYGKSTEELKISAAKREFLSLSDHRIFWLHCSELPKWIQSHKEVEHVKGASSNLNLEITDVVSKPFPVVLVRSENLINLKVGRPTQEEVDLLTDRLNSCYSLSSLDPHPLY